jgi:HEAT repeat protein
MVATGIETQGPGAEPAPVPPREPFAGHASWRDALSRWLGGADAAALGPLRDLVELARDPETPFELRVGAVRWIARDGDEAALEVLEDLLRDDTPAGLRAAIAEALGESREPAARVLLRELLDDDDEAVVRGALRGITAAPDALGILEAILLDPDRSTPVRAQAAASLGSLETEESSAALRAALGALDDEALVASVLDALGAHPFARNADAFRAVLANPDLPRAVKLEALEALGDSSADAAGLLLDYAARAPEAELRIAAVEALAFLGDSDAIAPWLLRLVESEPSPEVRAEIYGALAFHASAAYAAMDAERLVDVILSETGGPARLQAFRLVASILRVRPDPRLAEAFDARMVPWLQDQALRGAARHQRLASLDALKLAATPEATEALLRLSRSPDAALADAAERALRFGSSRRDLTAN